LNTRRTDPDSLRCIVCHERFYSWAEVTDHEAQHHRQNRQPEPTEKETAHADQ